MRSVMTRQFGKSSFAMAIGAISTLQTCMQVIGPLAFAQVRATHARRTVYPQMRVFWLGACGSVPYHKRTSFA